jgi:serine/threonine protein kinase
MNRSAWERAKALLADAAELPAADRDRFVAEQCPDPALRREVLEMLASPAALSGIVAANALHRGARLGPFVIERLIGSGGMGEVYEACDTILNRGVAIKVLPDSLAGDADRLSRWTRGAAPRDAQSPNIAHIHGFEESAGMAALVMELVGGPTLGDRIAHGPLPWDEALSIARQIADALEAAHEQGIVHRDLKPANIKVRDDGVVKVLDFGLAKVLDHTASSGGGPLKALSAAATQPGLVLGTAAYMAPEQARGQVVDKRADIWSFGCVLYEMLTGSGLSPATGPPIRCRWCSHESPIGRRCHSTRPRRFARPCGGVWRRLANVASRTSPMRASTSRKRCRPPSTRLPPASETVSRLFRDGEACCHGPLPQRVERRSRSSSCSARRRETLRRPAHCG